MSKSQAAVRCPSASSGFPAWRSTMPSACRLTASSLALAGSEVFFHSTFQSLTKDSSSASAVSSCERSRAIAGVHAKAAATARSLEKYDGTSMWQRDDEISVRVKCKFFYKIWKSLISTAIEEGMTSFTNSVEINSVQTPGGVRVGSTSRNSFSPFCLSLNEFIVPERRTPGGIRVSDHLTR